MSEVTTIGLDIAKSVFHAHGADASGRQLFSRRITRAKLLEFFRSAPLPGGAGGHCQSKIHPVCRLGYLAFSAAQQADLFIVWAPNVRVEDVPLRLSARLISSERTRFWLDLTVPRRALLWSV